MLFFASLFNKVSTDSGDTAKNGYCIYATNNKKCNEIVKMFETEAAKYNVVTLKKGEINATSVTGTDGIVVFIEDNQITSDELVILTGATKEEIKAYLCKITVDVKKDAQMPSIPLTLNYIGGPIAYTAASGATLPKLSQSDIKRINIKIQLKSEMEYDIYDNIDSTLPDNLQADEGKLSYKLISTSLDATRLKINGETLVWGSTTITPGQTKVTVPDNTIATWNGVVPKDPFSITGKLYIDDTFAVADPSAKNADTSTPSSPATTIIATLATVPLALKADIATKFFTFTGSATTYAVQCVYEGETELTTGCQNIGFKAIKLTKIGDVTPKPEDIVSFHGDVTIPKDKVDIIKSVLLTNDVKSITIKYDASAFPNLNLDLRKPIWTIVKEEASPPSPPGSGSKLLDTPTVTKPTITFSSNVNPDVISKSTGIDFTVNGLAITDQNKNPFDASTATKFSGKIIVEPYSVKGATVKVGNDQLKVNGVSITLPASKEVEVKGLPGQGISVSQNGANEKMKITLSTNGKIEFDATWNNFHHQIVTTQHGTVSTQYNGNAPPWLTTESLTQGTIEQPKPQSNPTTNGGLEGWSIALIVIACVIVVGAIVVVSLNFAGVIHLCGKQKVEV